MMDTKVEAEKDMMRSYLLGNLSDEEKARLEERFLTDGAYFERLSASEEELVDAYVHSELEGPDRERFERYFMQSPVQRARVERTAVVLQSLESARRQKVPSAVRPRPSRHAFRFLLAAAALVIAVTTAWLLTEQTRLRALIQQSQAALQQGHQVEQQLREQQKQAGVQIAKLSERLRELESPQFNSPILDVYPSRFARTADRPNELTVPSGAKTITLLLHSTSRSVYPTYRLEILNGANGVIWAGDGLVRQSTGEYVVSLPSGLLPPGGYTVQVYAPNNSQRVPIEGYRIQIATRP